MMSQPRRSRDQHRHRLQVEHIIPQPRFALASSALFAHSFLIYLPLVIIIVDNLSVQLCFGLLPAVRISESTRQLAKTLSDPCNGIRRSDTTTTRLERLAIPTSLTHSYIYQSLSPLVWRIRLHFHFPQSLPFTTATIASSIFAPLRNITRSFFSSAPASSPAAMSAAKQKAQQIIDQNPAVVFSKSYCPYCRATKSLLNEKHAKYYLLELDAVGRYSVERCVCAIDQSSLWKGWPFLSPSFVFFAQPSHQFRLARC